MADRIMAGRPTPTPRGNSTTPPDGPSAADLLENRLTQLKSLLACCYGDSIDWFGDVGPKHLDNVIWLIADLVDEAGELHQRCEKERAARS